MQLTSRERQHGEGHAHGDELDERECERVVARREAAHHHDLDGEARGSRQDEQVAGGRAAVHAREQRQPSRCEADADPGRGGDPRPEEQEPDDRREHGLHAGDEARRGDGRPLQPRRLERVRRAEQQPGEAGCGDAVAAERADTRQPERGERRAAERKPDSEERNEWVDRDRILDLDERHAPDGGDQHEDGECAHGLRFNRVGYRSLVGIVDTFGRPLHDLRISVTDRCNFRCVYCMPKEVYGRDHRFMDRKELLSFEEIARVASVFVRAGVRKIRITGGEPLVRRDLERLVAQLAPLDCDLTLTTNGSLLPQKAKLLAEAGLRRVTVSLDSLDDEKFRAMNDVDFPVDRVLDGIAAAAAAGLPVKVNAVVKRGVNEDQIVPLAARFRELGHTLRFIEYMDVGHTNGWRLDDVVPAREIVEQIDEAFGLEPVDPAYRGEVARRYRYRDGLGEVGVIASVTQPFCGDCTRARLSAEGRLFTCLFAVRGHDLRAVLRSGATDEELEERIAEVWSARSDRYSELRARSTPDLPKVEMSYIGG